MARKRLEKPVMVSQETHKRIAQIARAAGLLIGRLADTLLREALDRRAKEAGRG